MWDPKLIAAISAAIASAAFLFSVAKQSWDQRLQREARATSAWQDHLKLSFEYPRFAAAKVELDQWTPDREQYEWYVHRMLYAAETVLIYAFNDTEWSLTIKSQVQIHKDYIGGISRIEIPDYSVKLQELIYEVIGRASPVSESVALEAGTGALVMPSSAEARA